MSELRLEITGAIARLVISRREKRNAMSLAMWREIPEIVRSIATDANVRVLIVQGSDSAVFSVGADIYEIRAHARNEVLAVQFMDAVDGATTAIAQLPQAVIAMIRGDCIGGGIEIAMACDIRMASRDSRFSIPPSKVGALYGFRSTRRLVNLVGPGVAKDLLFGGRMFDAETALAMGLIEQVCAADEIEAGASAYAEKLCRRSRESISGAKQMVVAVLDGVAAEDSEIRRLRLANFLGADLREGTEAFLEKRKPIFR